MDEFITVALVLIGAHYVADFAMQNEYVATTKGDTSRPDWVHALTAHAAHHAVAAGLGMVLLGVPWMIPAIVTGVTHWMIDYGKAVRGWYGYHADQSYHLSVAIGIAIAVTLSGVAS